MHQYRRDQEEGAIFLLGLITGAILRVARDDAWPVLRVERAPETEHELLVQMVRSGHTYRVSVMPEMASERVPPTSGP